MAETQLVQKKPNVKIVKFSEEEITEKHFQWALKLYDSFKKIEIKIKKNADVGSKNLVFLGYLRTLLSKKEVFIKETLPNITKNIDRIPDMRLRELVKKDMPKISSILDNNNQLKMSRHDFLDRAVIELKNAQTEEEIQGLRNTIANALASVYKDTRLAKKVKNYNPAKLIEEASYLKKSANEIVQNNKTIGPESMTIYSKILRERFNDNGLANAIDKAKEDLPHPSTLDMLKKLSEEIKSGGFIKTLNLYVTNPKIITDRKTQLMFSFLKERVYAFEYFSAVRNRINFELNKGDKGEWRFFLVMSDERTLNAWINRLKNGYAINKGDLIAVSLAGNHWLLNQRIKDDSIAELLHTLRQKRIVDWVSELTRFTKGRISELSEYAYRFIQRRLTEIPHERSLSLKKILHLLESRYQQLTNKRRNARAYLIRLLNAEKGVISAMIDNKRRAWYKEVRTRYDEFALSFKDINGFLNENLLIAGELIEGYFVRMIKYWSKEEKKFVHITKSELDFVNMMFNIRGVYLYWYRSEISGKDIPQNKK